LKILTVVQDRHVDYEKYDFAEKSKILLDRSENNFVGPAK